MPPINQIRTALAGDGKPLPETTPAVVVTSGGAGLSSEEISHRLYPRAAEGKRSEPETAPAPDPPLAPPPPTPVGSLVSQGSVFDGTYQSEGDLTVEGEARGSVECKGRVVIRERAIVRATITAASVHVAGQLTGDVVCSERFEAAPTARIDGHITTPRLVIEEGARCDGTITMSPPA